MIETVPGVHTEIKTPAAFESDAFPTLHVHWDDKKFGLTVAQCNHKLKSGSPRIEVQTNENISGVLARIKTPDAPLGLGRPTADEMRILPITMQPGEELIVGNALRKILDTARKQAAG
jgi:L-seryl-tRNA(Ser) seleniumtransferase